MKTLSYDEVIALAAPEDADVLLANERIMAISPALWRGKPEDLYTGWKKGFFNCNQIVVQGKPSYVVWWTKQEPDCLNVLGVAAIGGGVEDFAALVEGCEQICTAQGCRFAMFHSVRKGMSRRLIPLGAHIAAVAYRMPNRKFAGNTGHQGEHD